MPPTELAGDGDTLNYQPCGDCELGDDEIGRDDELVWRSAVNWPMGRVEGMNLVDVGPTILKLYDIEAPEGVVGRSFL